MTQKLVCKSNPAVARGPHGLSGILKLQFAIKRATVVSNNITK